MWVGGSGYTFIEAGGEGMGQEASGGGGIGKLKCKEIKYSIKTGVYDYKNNYI